MIKISLNDTQAVQQLHNIARQLQQPRKLYGVLGETLKKIHAERFKQEVDPQGNGWQPLSAKTLARKQKKGKSKKVTIPKRPWLGVSQQDEQKLLRKATALLQRQIDQNL